MYPSSSTGKAYLHGMLEGENGTSVSYAESWRLFFNISANVTITFSMQILFGFLGVVLNLMAISVVAKGKKFKRLKIQLVNLAIAELLSSLTVPGSSAILEFANIPYLDSVSLCKVHQFIGYTVYQVSFLCQAVIAAEKFVAVYFPLRMIRYEKRHIIVVTIFTWLLGAIANIDTLFVSGIYDKQTRLICYANFEETDNKVLEMILLVSRYVIPTTITVFSYLAILGRLVTSRHCGNDKVAASRPVPHKVLFMLAVNGLVAVVMLLPHFIYDLIFLTQTRAHYITSEWSCAQTILYELFHVNCFIGPVIYTIFNRDFREELLNQIVSAAKKIRTLWR
ncbi:blue-sensitive opsin-like [Watersipora subatra]|uniref:blue-sensitive opsin-like n=1 Tax=Watersipora subatra TaxID=2589382 RepID=UPI00355B26A5